MIQPQTVLVVDDEADIRDPLREVLESEIVDVRVLTAGSGREALQLIENDAIDVLVADYRMPEMDGLDLLTAARKISPRTAGIMITAFPDLEITLRAINEDLVNNFLVKPFRPEHFVRVVRSLLYEKMMEDLRTKNLEKAIEVLRRRVPPGTTPGKP
ncbi:MAG: response regulator [Methanobacteriota archaeon]